MKTALVLVEVQNDYFSHGRFPLEKSDETCAKIEIVVKACREKKYPIIWVQHFSTDPEATYFLPCTKGAEFYSNLQPKPGEAIIKKHYPNSFKDTLLDNYLSKNGIKHLVVCGYMTHVAIDATVRAAHDLGYSCTVVQDGCTAHQEEFNNTLISVQNVHYAFLAALQLNYASVVTSEEFLQRTGVRTAPIPLVASSA